MKYLFSGCSNLTLIDISKFDTSQVTDMSFMFYGCSNLEKINFGNINTSSVKDMRSLFSNCPKITSIDLLNFDTSQVTYMTDMFYNCSNLKILDLKNTPSELLTSSTLKLIILSSTKDEQPEKIPLISFKLFVIKLERFNFIKEVHSPNIQHIFSTLLVLK